VAILLPAAHAAGSTAATAPWSDRLATALRSPGPWLVAVCFGVYSAQWLSLIGFLPTVYAHAGVSAGWAGAATALVALVNMIGNVAAGRLLQRKVHAPHLLAAGFVAMAVGAVLAFAHFPAALRYSGALMFSMVGGLVPGTLFSLGVRLAPSDGTVSTTIGWMQQWSALGQFAGPPVVALVASAVGGWQWSGAATGSFAMAGILLSIAIGRQLARQQARAH
jgi:cyanate permease